MSQQLLTYLKQEGAAVGTFIDLLDQEAQAMTAGNFGALPELAEAKSRQAEEILRLRAQREAEQLALGYTVDRDGVDAAVAVGGRALQKVWQELQERAARAKESNLRNGVMIHTHLEFTRNSIGFLQASGQPLYGPTGIHSVGPGPGNTLGLG